MNRFAMLALILSACSDFHPQLPTPTPEPETPTPAEESPVDDTPTPRPILDVDADGWFSDEDCDDLDEDIHPESIEWCNCIDDDCDDGIDEGCTYYPDDSYRSGHYGPRLRVVYTGG